MINNCFEFLKRKRKIRVGFIVQMPEIWDKLIDIYNEMSCRDDFDTILLLVPEYDMSTHSVNPLGEKQYFLDNYPEAIKVVNDDGKIINVKKFKLDYVFYQRPYDVYLPKQIRSNKVMKYAKCCYIPYGYTASDVFNVGNVDNEFFDNIYFGFMDSEYMKSLLYSKYKKLCDKGRKQFLYLGYPVLEEYMEMPIRNAISTITWTPRWSYDEKLGGSNFLEYKDAFLEMCQKLSKEMRIIFRPHPLMFDELIQRGLLTSKEKDNYLIKLLNMNIKVDMYSPIGEVLKYTDLLITDFSTIIGTYFFTGRPIVYCDKGIEFNEVYRDLAKFMYVTHSWNQVEIAVESILKGNDELAIERKKYIKDNYANVKGAAKRIVDKIACDFYKKGRYAVRKYE